MSDLLNRERFNAPDLPVQAVIVAFNGNWKNVARLVAELESDSIGYIIVDNGSTDFQGSELLNILRLGENFGIAHAQNVGIKYCRAHGARIIVFFDQDSQTKAGFVKALVQPILEGRTKIAAPVFFDIQAGFGYPIVHISRHGFRTKYYVEEMPAKFTTNVVISSGSAVEVEVFDVAGVMDAGLFIDYVDTEWCLRCERAGYSILIDTQVRMDHSIGDKSFKLWRFRIPVHSPARRYYRVRNAFLLARMPHVPKILALREILFSFVHQVLLIAVVRHQRRNYLKYLCIGIVHGIMNKRGRL